MPEVGVKVKVKVKVKVEVKVKKSINNLIQIHTSCSDLFVFACE